MAIPKEPLIITAISALAAQDEAFLDKVTSATVTHGALWPLHPHVDASVLRARYRLASASSENTCAAFLTRPR